MNNVNNRLQRHDYVVIQSFMINKYHLQGIDLMVYAIIDGYSQAPNQWYKTDGTEYIEAWTNASYMDISICLHNLINNGLILHKTELTDDNCVIHLYRTTYRGDK